MNYLFLTLLIIAFLFIFIVLLFIIFRILFQFFHKNKSTLDQQKQYNNLFLKSKNSKKKRKEYIKFVKKIKDDEINKLFVNDYFDTVFGKALLKPTKVCQVDEVIFENEQAENKALRGVEQLIHDMIQKKSFSGIKAIFINLDRLIIYFDIKLVLEKKDALAAFLNNKDLWKSYYESRNRLNLSLQKEIIILSRIKHLIKAENTEEKIVFNLTVEDLMNKIAINKHDEFYEQLTNLKFNNLSNDEILNNAT